MKISEVNIVLIKPKNGLVGFASVVVDDALYLGSIAIHQKLNGGFRLTYPTKNSGMHQGNIFHPINGVAGKALESAIFKKLNDVMNKVNNNAGYNSNLNT